MHPCGSVSVWSTADKYKLFYAHTFKIVDVMMMTYQITHAVPDLQLEVLHNFWVHTQVYTCTHKTHATMILVERF